jgi:hypothetical protein
MIPGYKKIVLKLRIEELFFLPPFELGGEEVVIASAVSKVILINLILQIQGIAVI